MPIDNVWSCMGQFVMQVMLSIKRELLNVASYGRLLVAVESTLSAWHMFCYQVELSYLMQRAS